MGKNYLYLDNKLLRMIAIFFIFISLWSKCLTNAVSFPAYYDRYVRLMRMLPFKDSKKIGDSIQFLAQKSLDRNILNPISLHNAKKDAQYLIAKWMRMEKSLQKKFILTKLLENPTVDFKIQDKFRDFYSKQVLSRPDCGLIDPQNLRLLSSVIDQAAQLGDLESVMNLMDKGLRITDSTLLAAAESGNVQLLKHLIKISNIQPDQSSLLRATLGGEIDMVKYLVEVKKLKVNLLVLGVAGRLASLEVLKYLLEKAEKTSDLVSFVLKSAAFAGRLDLVKYILKTRKTDPFFQANADIELLEKACESGSMELVQYLIDDFKLLPGIGCLNGASKSGNLKLVKFLLDFAIIPNQETFILSLSSDVFNPDLVKYFIENFSMHPSKDILYKAAQNGDLKFVKYLMNKLKIIPKVDLLEIACRAGKDELAIYLIEKKKLVPTDRVLGEAAWSGNLRLVKYLISYGIQPTSLTLTFASRGANADLKKDHSRMIEFIGHLLPRPY